MGRITAVASEPDWREPDNVQRSKLRWRETWDWCKTRPVLLADDGLPDSFAFDAVEQLRETKRLDEVSVDAVVGLAARLREKAGVA